MAQAATVDSKKDYPLEKLLRAAAKDRKRTSFSLVFDACREEVKTRAGHGGVISDEDEECKQQNLIITYGCPPSATVPARSTISESIFARLKERIDDATGQVDYGRALYGWKGTDGQSETIALSDKPMLYTLANHVPKNPAATIGSANAGSGSELE